MSVYEAKGREFESLGAHYFLKVSVLWGLLRFSRRVACFEVQVAQTIAALQSASHQVNFRTLRKEREGCGARVFLAAPWAETVCAIISRAMMSMEERHASERVRHPPRRKIWGIAL